MQNQVHRRAQPRMLLCASLSVLLAACGAGSDPDNGASSGDRFAATITSSDTAATTASTNLALNKAVTASTEENGTFSAKAAVDGNNGSRWASWWSDAQWISVDLGALTTFNHVKLNWEAAYAKAYQIQVATNGADWRTVYTKTGGGGGIEDLTFTAVSARYVRLRTTQRATSYGYSLWEFQVFNDNATTPPPTNPAPAAGALPTDAIFAKTSFWYTPIPANAPLHANSAGFVSDFQRQMQQYYGTVNINTVEYASPVYLPPAGTPTVAVKMFDCQNKGWIDSNLEAQWAAVPMPSYAQASNGTDGEMSIYQASSNAIWEFWQARKVNGQWQACWGGKIANASSNPGIWTHPYGTTATGLPFLGGQITPEELKRGEIRHAIGISLVEIANWDIVSWPANRSDGWNPNNAPNRIPEGARFRLDPAVNVDALNLHPMGKTIAKAAQKYGFVVWDKAGAISLRAQNPKSYTAAGQPDPYPALFNGTASYAVLNGFPWNRLQFMPKDYGRP